MWKLLDEQSRLEKSVNAFSLGVLEYPKPLKLYKYSVEINVHEDAL